MASATTAKRKRHGHSDSDAQGAHSASKHLHPSPVRKSARLQELARENQQNHQLLPPSAKPEPPSSSSSAPDECQIEEPKAQQPQAQQPQAQQPEESNALQTNPEGSDPEPYNPIRHWATTTYWPKDLWQRGFGMPAAPSNKMQSSSIHRTQVVALMARQGVSMETNSFLRRESANLCKEYRRESRSVVKSSIFNPEEFARVLNRVRHLNEARIQRDVTPWVVPSAETLFIRGELNHAWIGEELNAQWIRCAPMGGKTPKPDYAAGLLRSSFSKDEEKKLANYASTNRPFCFTPELCFPFLICEAKAADRALIEANRQNIHSASIAVRAIILLYQEAFRATEPHRVEELYGQVLVFTVSHNHEQADLYGHYAVADSKFPDGLKFHCHLIASCRLDLLDGEDSLKAYNFVFNVYEKFAPDHRKRIQDAVAQLSSPATLPDMPPESLALVMESSESQPNTQAGSSQGDVVFKKPALPLSVTQQLEIEKLRKDLDQQAVQSREQVNDLIKQMHQEKLEREQERAQAEQERAQAEQERAQAEQERAQAKQERELMEQERAQAKQERELMEQNFNDLMALLRGRGT